MNTDEILNIYEELNSLSPIESKAKFNNLRLTYKQWLEFTSSWEELYHNPYSENTEEFHELYSQVNDKEISFDDFRKAFNLNRGNHTFGQASKVFYREGRDITECQDAQKIENQFGNLMKKIYPITPLKNAIDNLINISNQNFSMENIDEFYERFLSDKGTIIQLLTNVDDLYSVENDVDYCFTRGEIKNLLRILEQRFLMIRDNISLQPMELLSKIGIRVTDILQYIQSGSITSIQIENGKIKVDLSGEINPLRLFLSDIPFSSYKEEFDETFRALEDTPLPEKEISLTDLQKKESELSSLEEEEKTISEAESLIDQQRPGQNIGEE